MKLNDIGTIATLVIIVTFLVIGADKLGVINLHGEKPIAETTAKK